jgi:hypothetical protein
MARAVYAVIKIGALKAAGEKMQADQFASSSVFGL